MKNKPDSLFFARLFVPQAPQNSFYRRAESEIQLAIPPTQCVCGMEIIMKRDSYFDNYKAFLIFLVVMAHYLEPLGNDMSLALFIRKVVYLFHMPAFAFVSGYFSKHNSFEKLVKRLIVPYTIAQIGFYFLANYLWEVETDFTLFTPNYTLWFLLSLFVWRCVIDRVSMIKGIVPIAFFIGILAGFDDSIGRYLSLSRMITFFPYFLLGYQFDKAKFMEFANKKPVKISAGILLAGIFGWLCLFSESIDIHLFESCYSYEKMELSNGWLQRGILYVIATGVIYLIAVLIPRKQYWFSYIGSRTMGIYLTHGAIVKTLQYCTSIYDFFDSSAGVVLLIGFSLLLCLVLSSNKINQMVGKLSCIPIERIVKRRCTV